MSRHHIVTSHPLDVVGEGIITITKAPAPSGRIKPGERVHIQDRDGTWRVIAFHRDGTELESVRASTRTVVKGIAYSRLKRVTR